MNSGFKWTIIWNKYLIKDLVQTQNQNLDFLVNPSFQGVHKLLVLLLKNEEGTRGLRIILFQKGREIKDYKVKINGWNSFDQPVNNEIKTWNHLKKIWQVKEMTIQPSACCIIHAWKNFKMIAIDLSKQKPLNADPKVNYICRKSIKIHIYIFICIKMLFILEEVKETILDLSQGTVKVFYGSETNFMNFIWY